MLLSGRNNCRAWEPALAPDATLPNQKEKKKKGGGGVLLCPDCRDHENGFASTLFSVELGMSWRLTIDFEGGVQTIDHLKIKGTLTG